MSYPNIVYGDFGDEKRAQSTRIGNNQLSTLMILPDGREFHHGSAPSGTALSAGYLQQMPAVPSDTMIVKSLVPNGTIAIGATSVAGTTGGTSAISTDQFRDGYLIVPASTAQAGAGRMYKIRKNNSAASGSATVTVDLDYADPIDAALPGGTTTFGLRENEYANVIVTTADTVFTGPFAGIPQVAVSAGFFCWLQTKGPALAFVGGTVLIAGSPIVASTGVAGAVADFPTTAADTAGVRYAKQLKPIGYGMTTGSANGFALVNLDIR